MIGFKTISYTLAAASVLAFSSSAYANMYQSGGSAAYGSGGALITNPGASGRFSFVAEASAVTNFPRTIPGSSQTASFFFRQGVRNFEKGNLTKSDRAFKAALRANGSKNLDKLTLHYLAYINQQQGDEFAAKKYAQSYLNLEKK